jgi:hypothetical protein
MMLSREVPVTAFFIHVYTGITKDCVFLTDEETAAVIDIYLSVPSC